DRDFLLERFAGASVVERALAARGQSRAFHQLEDFLLARAIEYRRANVDTVAALGGELEKVAFAGLLDQVQALLVRVELAKPFSELRGGRRVFQLALQLASQLARPPSEM